MASCPGAISFSKIALISRNLASADNFWAKEESLAASTSSLRAYASDSNDMSLAISFTNVAAY